MAIGLTIGVLAYSYLQGMRRQSAELEQLRAQLIRAQSRADALVEGLRLMDAASDLHGAQQRVLADSKQLATLRAAFEQARVDRQGAAALLSENEWREHQTQ